ncbi:MAG: hypothetical protein CL880_04585 [Dehalococcoidia bacterium]|nr:hypothetical protein [Dehalococcoidia bacterium]MAX04548.1 hypothetical protein [Dehalococcoidia bacterium]
MLQVLYLICMPIKNDITYYPCLIMDKFTQINRLARGTIKAKLTEGVNFLLEKAVGQSIDTCI